MIAHAIFSHVQHAAQSHLPEGDATQWELMFAEMKMNERAVGRRSQKIVDIHWRTVLDKASPHLLLWLKGHWGVRNAVPCEAACPTCPARTEYSSFPVRAYSTPSAAGGYQQWARCGPTTARRAMTLVPAEYFVVQ